MLPLDGLPLRLWVDCYLYSDMDLQIPLKKTIKMKTFQLMKYSFFFLVIKNPIKDHVHSWEISSAERCLRIPLGWSWLCIISTHVLRASCLAWRKQTAPREGQPSALCWQAEALPMSWTYNWPVCHRPHWIASVSSAMALPDPNQTPEEAKQHTTLACFLAWKQRGKAASIGTQKQTDASSSGVWAASSLSLPVNVSLSP